MNNTSAYANVLLKSPSLTSSVLKTPEAITPRRDYERDNSSADFQQTFNAVHDNQKRQDDKVSKPVTPKKATQVERHSEAKNTKEVKDVKAARETSKQQKPADDSADINRNTVGNEAVRQQPVQHKNKDICADKVTEEESAQAATNLVADINPEASPNVLVVSAAVNGMGIGVAQSTLAVGAELTATTNEPVQTQEDSLSAEINAASSSIDSESPLFLVKSMAETPVSANTIKLETEDLVNASLNLDASVKLEASGEVVNQPIDPLILADAQVLAASLIVSGAAKPLQPQAALAEISEATDEVIDLLAPSVTETSVSAKAAPASNFSATNTTASPEVTTAQAHMNASKTAFEKTLQTIVSPDASRADDRAAPALNSSSTNNVTNPLMDSLMRGADQQTPAARNFVVQTAVPIPVGQPQWSQAVGEKVLWLAAQNVSSAEINLHPKDLGPIQVKVSVNQEQTTVSFTSQHAVVREVLDQNLNRLRDMFSEQGLNLVNVDVSDKSFSRQQGDTQDQKGQGGSQNVASEEETAIAMSAIVQQRLVDHYA